MPERESLLPQFKLFSRRSSLGLCFAILSAVVQLLCGGWYTSAIVFALLFLVLGVIDFRLPAKAQLPVLILVYLCASFVTFWLTQFVLGGTLRGFPFRNALLGCLISAIVLLFFLLLTARPFPALCIGMVLLLFLSTVDCYVYMFRGNEFMPTDIFSITTAGNVAAEYDFTPNLTLVRAWLMLLMFLFAVSALHLRKLPRLRFTLVSVPLLLLLVFVFRFNTRSAVPSYFAHIGSYENGFLLNFTLQIEKAIVRKPEGYDPAQIKALPSQSDPAASDSTPTIIVIMNESFADLSVFGPNFRTDTDVMPFFHSLSENTIKGFACSSVFGGSTANSEFEFLTGHSMAFLPAGSTPYQQFLKGDVSSVVWALKDRGYTCVAMHPYKKSGWKRTTIYPAMGFDEMYFIEDLDFPLLRNFPSDQGMYDQLIRYYEQRDKSTPLFFFGITMQNHGGYLFDSELYPSTVHLEDPTTNYMGLEQYLTLIHDSDAALADLIRYFSDVDDDVVLLMFGDHLPAISGTYYWMINGSPQTLDEQELLYTVPYVVWTNYDSPEQTPPLTSLNYLSNYVFEAAGIPLPPYNQYLRQFQQTVPVVNNLGYYSPSAGRFLTLDEAAGEEAAVLSLYDQLEYNALFDSKNRLPMFRTGAVG